MPAPTTIGGTVVAVLILIGLFLWYRFTPHEKDREKAIKFLDDLSAQIEKILMEVVSTIDITKYHTLEELEFAIFRIANNNVWEFVSEQIILAIDNGTISALVGNLITRQNVELLLTALFTKCGISTIAGAKWNEELEEGYDEAENFEKEITERNKQLEEGTVPDVDEDHFVPPNYEPIQVNGDIIPPHDDEVSYSGKDDTIEILEDDEKADDLPERRVELEDLVDPEDFEDY